MKNGKPPITFVLCNVSAILAILILLYTLEPVQGMFPPLALLVFMFCIIFSGHYISTLLPNLPPLIKVIGHGLSDFLFSLCIGWLGWEAHKLYLQLEKTGPSLPLGDGLFILFTVCVITTMVRYKQHHQNSKK